MCIKKNYCQSDLNSTSTKTNYLNSTHKNIGNNLQLHKVKNFRSTKYITLELIAPHNYSLMRFVIKLNINISAKLE